MRPGFTQALGGDADAVKGNAWKQGYSITGIEAGFKGIFATCDRGKEGKCVAEMYGLLEDVGPSFH